MLKKLIKILFMLGTIIPLAMVLARKIHNAVKKN
jgi:uncharacterized membrane protein YhaH (DUF805 family)